MHPSSRSRPDVVTSARPVARRRRRTLGSFGAVALLVALYSLGLFHRGYESKHITFAGFSRVESGRTFGARTMHLRKGQTLVVKYEADVRNGGLRVWLARRFAPMAEVPGASAHIERSGSGELRFAIAESSIYDLTIRGTPGGRGYDVSYTLSWRVE